MRWALLDEVLEIQKGKRAQSRSRVPQAPCSPQVLMIEMMAQTGALLVGAGSQFEQDVVFAKIEEAFFEENLVPGTPLFIEAVCDSLRPEGAWIEGSIRDDRSTVARSRLLLMNVGRLAPDRAHSVTFHPEFLNHYKILEKVR